ARRLHRRWRTRAERDGGRSRGAREGRARYQARDRDLRLAAQSAGALVRAPAPRDAALPARASLLPREDHRDLQARDAPRPGPFLSRGQAHRRWPDAAVQGRRWPHRRRGRHANRADEAQDQQGLRPRPLGPVVGRLALERLARRRRGRVRRPALLPGRHSADRSDGEAAGSGRCALMRTAREAAIFVPRGGQFLLMHRAQDDYWHVAAGVVEEGESFADAAARELREETGLDLPITDLAMPQGYRVPEG